MSDDASRLIEQLFERLQEAEKQTGERDSPAESQINKHLIQQPSAPYYMAQTIIMQEAALKRLNARVEHLERSLAEKPTSGGFLSGLFGTDSSRESRSPGARSKSQSGWGEPRGQQKAQGFSRQQGNGQQPAYGQGQANQQHSTAGNRSFLGGALQTAAGVAGGVVVGSMLMNMFGHHTPTEMVDVIQQEPTGEDFSSDSMGQSDAGQSDFASNDFGSADTSQDGFGQAGFDQNNDFGQAGFDQAGFGDANLGSNEFDQGDFGDIGSGFDDFGGGFGDDFDV
ncbi:DUF2076 domain-containing protein [Marinomonas pollencensis]|uniref:DUF2076 family protein n=1 Tax=Marinomonas pollencensis TaxID=491954 RepID=A0A3E0DFE4_9GAMM|nr:DUF2076 domain-containing protein [Marinomonas pollencensis]REG81307.1 hypothetical protein DFP81_11528 [Marinomonas pollencensis]